MNDVCRLWSWRPGHWANWAFEIGATDADKGMFDFAKGGFQGGRGHAHGAEWFVENVFEVGHLLASCFLPMIAPLRHARAALYIACERCCVLVRVLRHPGGVLIDAVGTRYLCNPNPRPQQMCRSVTR